MSNPPPQVIATKQNETKKSILVVPSKAGSKAKDLEGAEETEIAAQITVPEQGKWKWVVVAASFSNIFILDGIFFTFGSIFHDMSKDFTVEESLIALINSIALAVYYLAGPLVSALINRFGFRACTMSGGAILAAAFFSSYFAVSYAILILFYGVIGGFGACLVNMSSGLVVGFYFERLRSLALAIAGSGSSVGIMVLFIVNTHLVSLVGWRLTTLFHSGLFGLIYFFGMTFRPLLAMTVTKTTEDPTRTVTYLPSLAAIKTSSSPGRKDGLVPTTTERLFSAVSNAHFPTAASVVEEGVLSTPSQPGPSTAGPSKTGAATPGPSTGATGSRLTVTAHGPQSGLSHRQFKQIQSIISKSSVHDNSKQTDPKLNIEINANIQPPKKTSWWRRLFHWEEHVPQSRPMYRDDAFYEGRIEDLPAFKKSVLDTTEEGKTGLEYQMAVSRAVAAEDLEEKRGVFTTAFRRILATMMDPKLLKKCSFLLLCASGFFTFSGFLVPYVFLPDRNSNEGISAEHCNLFVSVIGFSNAVGRLVVGALACKYSPLRLYLLACIISGIGIIMFNLSFNVYYQYIVCVIFGFHISCLSSIRSMVLVELYGLDHLTNATGIMVLFQGIGSLISTPVSSILKTTFNYAVSFYVAGVLVIISGCLLLPVKNLNKRENKLEREKALAKSPDNPVNPQKS